MPYQTLPIFSSNFHFSSAIVPPPPPPFSPLCFPCQEERGMDSVDAAAALKSSFRPEMEAVKTTPPPQGLNDEVWGEDESFVDEFLDFSNEDVDGFLPESREEEEEEEEEEKEGEGGEKDCYYGSASSLEETHLGKSSYSISNYDFGAELCVPTDDLANLEWLSHFVEDSFSQFPSSSDSVPFSMENSVVTEQGKSENPTETGSKEEVRTTGGCLGLTMETPVPAKARSKRSRASARVWSVHGRHLAETSPTSSSSSSSSSPSSSSSYSSFSSQSSPSSCLIFAKTAQNQDSFNYFGKPPSKRPKKEKKKPLSPAAASENSSQLQPQRRCSHCLMQKTPQWRTGPLGAKTLCNACGVRYKSGRLLPEYRPAGSPTFLSSVHSNSHRKVLEMRRKKETAAIEPGPLAVQSF